MISGLEIKNVDFQTFAHSFGTDNPFNPDNGGSNTFLNSLNTP